MTTLTEALESWNSDAIKKYIDLLGLKKTPTRKADRIALICQELLQKENLHRLWRRLDPVTQRAVSDAYHNGGLFDSEAFIAQYGELPPRPKKGSESFSYSLQPILFDLLVIGGAIPTDLMPLLVDLVLPVERFQLEGLDEPPASLIRWRLNYEIIRADTELVGRVDLLTYLQMVEQGALKWSEKNKELTAASVRKLHASLMAGDFHPEPEKITGRTVVRPFGLDIFAQGAGLVTSTGKLTAAGRQYLQAQDPESFLEAFEKWVIKGKFDELARITQLNGLNARGARLTAPATRREKIIEALSWCPANVWISIGDFYRAVKIWHFDFDVETTAWSNLYAGPYKEYGYMSGNDYWLIVKGLYINAIIMEYLATIGAVDVAYISDELTLIDTQVNYLEEAYSLHDGLLYFRINNWGAFLLGQATEYTPSKQRKRALFTIDEQLRLHLVAAPLPHEQLLLEALAEPLAAEVYQLDGVRLLTAVESGQKLAYLTEFLEENHRGPLPGAVVNWLGRLKKNVGVFREGDAGVLVFLKRRDARALIEEDAVMPKLCRVLDDTAVLVLSRDLGKFRNRLKALGYLLA